MTGPWVDGEAEFVAELYAEFTCTFENPPQPDVGNGCLLVFLKS